MRVAKSGWVPSGWFMGAFAITDTSWVMTTHRWLGTSTDVLAVERSEVDGLPATREI